MESIKNQGRKTNRFTKCFKPVDMEDGGGSVKTVAKKGGSVGDHAFAYNAVDSVVDDNNKDSKMVPVVSSSSSDERVKVSNEVISGKKKKPKFSRILKAVMFETSLAKKIQNKKWRKNSFRSSSNLSTKSEKSSIIHEKSTPPVSSSDEDNECSQITTDSNISSSRNSIITSDTTTTTLGTSRSSSITSSSRSMSVSKASLGSNSMETKQREDGWNHGLCLLLVTLLVLIFWGKVCAIFCTSTWIFLVARWATGQGSPGITVGFPEVDSVEYKKKVIMEGLLGRNRNRVL